MSLPLDDLHEAEAALEAALLRVKASTAPPVTPPPPAAARTEADMQVTLPGFLGPILLKH